MKNQLLTEFGLQQLYYNYGIRFSRMYVGVFYHQESLNHYINHQNTLICVCDRCIPKFWPSMKVQSHPWHWQNYTLSNQVLIQHTTPMTGKISAFFQSALRVSCNSKHLSLYPVIQWTVASVKYNTYTQGLCFYYVNKGELWALTSCTPQGFGNHSVVYYLTTGKGQFRNIMSARLIYASAVIITVQYSALLTVLL